MISTELMFTGERFVPNKQDEIRLEHYQRYALTLEAIADKVVLDVACGEGYGSFLMAGVAAKVTGVDVDAQTINCANLKYANISNNLKFENLSATNLNLPAASFDVVVSFETIEHLSEQSKMLGEIRRVLRPDGFLIISSPNRPIYSDNGRYNNQFHVKELDFLELNSLLRSQFPSVRYFGQRLIIGSAIMPVNEPCTDVRVSGDDGGQLNPLAGKLTDPVYFVAVCGASDACLPELRSSILLPDRQDLLQKYLGYARWAKNTNDEFERVRDLYTKLDQEHKKVATWAQSLNQVVEKRDDQIGGLNQTVSVRDRQIAKLNEVVAAGVREVAELGQAVVERDVQIVRLKDGVTKSEVQVAGLNQTVADREGQITSLNQMVNEKETQVAGLSQVVADREGQIASLNRTVNEKETQVAGLSQLVVDREGQIVSLNQMVNEKETQVAGLSQVVADRDTQIANLTDETVRRGEWALRLDAELKEERARFAAIAKSNSWRMTLPLREARRWFGDPVNQAKRYTKAAMRLAKQTYQSLPLSYQAKAAHRQLLAKNFPKLLRLSGSPPLSIPAYSVPSPTNNSATSVVLPAPAAGHQTVLPVVDNLVSDNPVVSIIIPIYGQCDYTLRCLASIAANPPEVTFELVIVDDCSPDDSFEVLSKVAGVRLLRNEQNQGFIRSCNAGAKAARGEFLYFLNNDTEVTQGWLDALRRTFHDFPGTGLAGSKLIYPDGRLQEAGGIIWQDGSAWNFGRFQDPTLPVYNYAREVDYCSGASIMVPKALFEELGGFDEHYLPAYCEDCDLALKIRDKGCRVIYQPMSTVIHYEGITSGTDTSHGAKAYQVENTKKLYARWSSRLLGHQQNGSEVDSAKDRRTTRRVLVLDHCTPTPNEDAGSLLVFNLLLLLREMDFQVTFVPEDNFLYMPEHTQALQRAGIEVLYAPYVTTIEQHVKEFGARYVLALLIRPVVVERHIKNVRKFCVNAKVLFHTVDLHFLRMSREAELHLDERKKAAALDMKQRELVAINASDAAIVVSTAELEILHAELPAAKLHVFPLILDAQAVTSRFHRRNDIVFVGGYQHMPNVDAVKYFVSEIMPLLRTTIPGVRFNVVGSKPPAEVQALASSDVIITGFVQNLTPLLNKMRVSVAPLRFGAGIKGKIGTSMAVGLPVVATSLAAEGMLLSDGENVLVADGAEEFARAITKIYQDELLWETISKNGLLFADQTWGAKAAYKILTTIIEDLGINIDHKVRPFTLYAN